ncbi:Glycerophosphodiester phosphodiesterase [subsurface metagenome]
MRLSLWARVLLVLALRAISAFAYLDRTEPPLILAHRAGALVVPENTIEGWAESRIRYQPDVWELDVHLTEDDSLVVIHDEAVDRTTNGSGLVREMTYTQIRSLDAGFWFTPDSGKTYPWRGKGLRIPTIGQVFDSFPDDNFNIEIKDSVPDAANRIVSLIREKNMQEKVLVASVYTDVLKRVRQLDPSLPTSGSEDEIRPLVILGKMGLGFLARTPMDAVQVPEYSGSIHVVTPGFVKRCHRKGIQVHVWTVNDAEAIKRLLEMSADGIITDRPDVADRVAKTMGFREFPRNTPPVTPHP